MKKKIIFVLELILVIWFFKICCNYEMFAGKEFFNIHQFFKEYGIWSILYIVVCGFFEDYKENDNLKKINIRIKIISFIATSFILACMYLYILKGSFTYQQLQVSSAIVIGMMIVRLIIKVIKGIRSMLLEK